jgi:hypothetical protein
VNEPEEMTRANLRVATGHSAAMDLLRTCENTEEIWLCALLMLGILNQTLNRVHNAEYTIRDVLEILAHYDEHVPMVEATADQLASTAVRTIN